MTVDLTPVRDLLQADGADIELVDQDSGVARLRLVLENAGCADCVVPRTMLEDVALQLLKSVHPDIISVVIDDPREV